MKRSGVSAAFEGVMRQLLARIGLPPFAVPPQAYRLRFGAEPPLYVIQRGDRWLEVLTSAGRIPSEQSEAVAAALLALPPTPDGPLHCTCLDRATGNVSLRTRLPLAGCRADDLLQAMEALRRGASMVRVTAGGRERASGTAAVTARGSTVARVRSRFGKEME